VTKVSIVTPVYNQARYLPACLASVGAIRTDHEHVIVDGGSTDGTVDLLKTSNTEWTSEPDRGQTHAVNKALARARGELLAWLNGDDEYVADAIDRAVAHLDANAEAMAVYGGMEVTDEDGTVQRTYIPAEWSWKRYLFLGDYVPTPTFVFRRKLLDERGPLDERWRDAADYDFYLRLLHGVRVDRLPEPLVRFRFHEESKTGSNVWIQQDEALAIRLCWAKSNADRAFMIGFDRAKRAILPRISPWPKLIPDEDDRGSAVTRAADAWRRVRAR
jgi:glycosyltransferase involved in cell wall biosynthesis